LRCAANVGKALGVADKVKHDLNHVILSIHELL
jgi:hypothetical protein